MGAACVFSPLSLCWSLSSLARTHTTPWRTLHSLTVPSHLQNTKARLKVIQKELKDLQWEHEVLEQRFSKVRAAGGSGHPLSLFTQG